MPNKAFEATAKGGGVMSVSASVWNFFASTPLQDWVQYVALIGGILYIIHLAIRIRDDFNGHGRK